MLALKCYNVRNVNLKITCSTSTYVYYLRITWMCYLHCITCTTWYIHVHMLACMSHAKNIHFQTYMQKKWPSTGPNFPKFWENTPLPIPSPSHVRVLLLLLFPPLYVPAKSVPFSPFIKAWSEDLLQARRAERAESPHNSFDNLHCGCEWTKKNDKKIQKRCFLPFGDDEHPRSSSHHSSTSICCVTLRWIAFRP